jgi:methylmalonyl-CoA mutase
VGVNKYQLEEEEDLHILEVDNEEVRRQQIKRLEDLKERRNEREVTLALDKITQAARQKLTAGDKQKLDEPGADDRNLLALAITAARARATLGEISTALEEAFGRHTAEIKSITGVYSKEIKDDDSFHKARAMADQFAEQEGRRPRIMIAKMGQDGHDRGAKVVATGYADLGFDVDIGPLFQTPAEAAKQAVENDVHILGVSSLAGGHKTLVPQLIRELGKHGRDDIMVIVGGVVPKQDYQFLFDSGAVAVFGPGSKISDAAIQILGILLE